MEWVDEIGVDHELDTEKNLFFFFLLEVYLIYDVVLVSGVQQK